MPSHKPGNSPCARARLNRVRRLLKLQEGRCFYCEQPISEEDASIDHLVPKSAGGSNTDVNTVVCCRSLNYFFADASLEFKLKLVDDPDFLTVFSRWCLKLHC